MKPTGSVINSKVAALSHEDLPGEPGAHAESEDVPPRSHGAGERPKVSIVLFYSQSVSRPYDMLGEFLAWIEEAGPAGELVIVVDGQLGQLFSRIQERVAGRDRVKLLMLNTRQGQVATIRTGASLSSGQYIVTFPAYPQVDLRAVTPVVEALEKGAEYVVGYRIGRRSSVPNRIASSLFNSLVRRATGVGFRDIACGVHGVRRQIVRAIPNYGDNQLFVPILLAREGIKVQEVPVPQNPAEPALRLFSPLTFLRRCLDLFTLAYLVRFTQKPLRPFGALGVLLFLAGLVISLILVYQRLFLGRPMAERPMLLLGLLLVTAGIQVIIMGFLGELMIYLHFRDQTNYRIEERIEAEDEKE